MDRKEKVLSYIKSREYVPLRAEELAAVLCVPQEDFAELEVLLGQLCEEGKILKTKKKRYEPNKAKNTIEGILSCSSHGFFGFVDGDEGESVYIKGERMNGALNGDRVLAAIIPRSGEKAEGHIVKVLEHANKTVSGIVKRKKRDYFSIYPDSPKLYTHVHVLPNDMLDAVLGDRVVAEITDFYPDVRARVIKKLGSASDVKSKTEAILFINGIEEEFPSEVIKEAEEIADSVTEDEFSGREDLRNLQTITIDGDTARDFDDAVSLDVCKNGNYRLGVHIADVTHYVREGSELDKEAFKRGTSVYLPDRAIPMLPKKLSNGICSLNPKEDRLTLSVIAELTKSGELVSHKLVKSVIHSDERMTYSDTAALLENPSEELKEKYGYLIPMLKNMKELSDMLRKKRFDRGSIDFDFTESKIIVNEYGEPEDILPDKRETTHKIIEDFMLFANELVAEYAFWSEIPFVYRVHRPPEYEKMCEFRQFAAAFGIKIKENFSETEPIHPKALQTALEKIKGTPEEHMISVYTLRSLMKAEYMAENLGHFGLAASYYCHFTSPIRRYPDLAIHRILKDFIDGKSLDKYRTFAENAANRSSKAERRAQEVEREVDDVFKAVYMSGYVGYIFDAKISSVTEFGIFAELENTAEGLIRVENMKDDYYIFDSEKRCLVGRDSGKTYKIGDDIEIAVAACNTELGKIDFIFAENADMSDIDRLQKREYKHMRERRKKISNARGSNKYTRRKRR